MKGKVILSVIFVATFALSRIPDLLPSNFSVAYAFAFCAGVYLSGIWGWVLPLGVMLGTDVALNIFHYHEPPLAPYQLLNYACFVVMIALGRWFGRKASFLKLVTGGVLGAFIFYLATNTLSWLQDPAYAKTIAGWIQALTLGRPEWHPTTWEMFRNTLMSGGLFTALFAAAAKLTAESPAEKTAGQREPEKEAEAEPASEPEEAKA
jgi:hypothetical protein